MQFPKPESAYVARLLEAGQQITSEATDTKTDRSAPGDTPHPLGC